MVERTPREAVERYRRALQRVLSCVTDGVLVAVGAGNGNPYQPGTRPHMLLLGAGHYVPVSGDQPFLLNVAYRYDIAKLDNARRQWRVRTRQYTFSIALDENSYPIEIVTYHWHPEAKRGKTFPHLHIGPAITGTGLQFGNRYVHRMHVPTGVVPLASIIRLAIEEFGIRPLRDDWRQVLTQHASA